MVIRQLGKSGFEVSPLGLGCMPIGGPMLSGEAGDEKIKFILGDVNDKESMRSIHKAMALGINFFDTAPAYGAGHSERLLGQAFAGCRDKIVISTKFGKKVNEGNGISIIRPTFEGLSIAVDYQDRVLAVLDDFTTEDVVMIADVPTESRTTIYSQIGDLFAWLCVVGFVTVFVWAIVRRKAS
jgi:aryl-alcohol dehydrogenase-like predicted oxidoreductase